MRAIRKSSVFAALLLGIVVSSARAQGIVTVKVPFSFVVGHEEFPAGQYEIHPVSDAGTILSIQGVNNKSVGFALTIPADGGDPDGDQPALVFIRHEATYRLSQVWDSRNEGREVPGISASHKSARTEPAAGEADARYVVAANWK